MFNYSIDHEAAGDKLDFMIDRGLDEVKLKELIEHEPKLWGPASEKM